MVSFTDKLHNSVREGKEEYLAALDLQINSRLSYLADLNNEKKSLELLQGEIASLRQEIGRLTKIRINIIILVEKEMQDIFSFISKKLEKEPLEHFSNTLSHHLSRLRDTNNIYHAPNPTLDTPRGQNEK